MNEDDLVLVIEDGEPRLYKSQLNAEAYANELRERFKSATFFVKPHGAYFGIFTKKGVYFGADSKG